MLLFAAEQILVSFLCSQIHSRFLATYSCTGLDLSCFCMGLKHCLFTPSFRAVMPCPPSVRFIQLNPAPCYGCVPCTCEHCTLFSTTIHINREEYNPGFCFHAGKTSTKEGSSSTTLHLKVTYLCYFPLIMFSWEEWQIIKTSVLFCHCLSLDILLQKTWIASLFHQP